MSLGHTAAFDIDSCQTKQILIMSQSAEFGESQCFLTRGNVLTVSRLLDETDILSPRELSGRLSASFSPSENIYEPLIDNYSDDSEHIADLDSMRSGESIIKVQTTLFGTILVDHLFAELHF